MTAKTVTKKNIKVKHNVNKELLIFESEGIIVNKFYKYVHAIELQLGDVKVSKSFEINEFEKDKPGYEELLTQRLTEVANLIVSEVKEVIKWQMKNHKENHNGSNN